MPQEDRRAQTVCFTGHRELLHPDIPERLDALIGALCRQGFCTFAAGGAPGFDTEAALAIIRAQETAPITLSLILPYPGQAARRPAEHRKQYEEITQKAASVTYTSDYYTRGCFHQRNRALVDSAALCVAYLVKSTGGTAYTVRYAEKQGVPVINIADK